MKIAAVFALTFLTSLMLGLAQESDEENAASRHSATWRLLAGPCLKVAGERR
jgi:hypothetical protein